MPQRKRDSTPSPPASAKPRSARKSPPSKKSTRKHFDFDPNEWTPLNDAFACVCAALGSRDLAEHELQQRMQSGRLASASAWIDHLTGESAVERLEASFWQGLGLVSISPGSAMAGHVQVRATSARMAAWLRWLAGKSTCVFYVSRSDLDKLYLAAQATAASAAPNRTEPPPRRRGPVTKYDWIAFTAEVCRRCIGPSGRIVVTEDELGLADDMIEWCELNFGLDQIPAESARREAVKTACAAMRKGRDRPRKK
jgi:hypothetical protein